MKKGDIIVRDLRQKTHFAVDDEYLNGYAKVCGWNATLVYLCLCRHSDKNQYSFPSISTMAEKLNISRDSVMRGLTILEKLNIIIKQKCRHEKTGRWWNNAYWLVDKSKWKKQPSRSQRHGHQVAHSYSPSRSQQPIQVADSDTKDSHSEGSTYKDRAEPSSATIKATQFNPLGSEIIKAFEIIDPKNKTYYANKTQRAACDYLLEEYGLDAILKRVSVLSRTNKIPYFPNITSPLDLKEKWVKLEDAVEQKRREKSGKIKGLA